MHEILDTKKNVSVIIPAFNEEKTIGRIVDIAISHKQVREVIVVDDGSHDATPDIAKEHGAKVIIHEKNIGKAGAMNTGAKSASCSILFFIDGDILGLTHKIINTAINSVVSNKSDMYILITDHGSLFSEKFIKALPLIAGVRVIRKSVWNSIPVQYMNRFEIEMVMNFFAHKYGARVESKMFKGLTQLVKEVKRGLIWGLYQRMFMIRDLIFAFIKLHVLYGFRFFMKALFVSEKRMGK